jgi:hypothetical protein
MAACETPARDEQRASAGRDWSCRAPASVTRQQRPADCPSRCKWALEARDPRLNRRAPPFRARKRASPTLGVGRLLRPTSGRVGEASGSRSLLPGQATAGRRRRAPYGLRPSVSYARRTGIRSLRSRAMTSLWCGSGGPVSSRSPRPRAKRPGRCPGRSTLLISACSATARVRGRRGARRRLRDPRRRAGSRMAGSRRCRCPCRRSRRRTSRARRAPGACRRWYRSA